MKNKILLSLLLTIFTCISSAIYAQDTEYYRPDSLKNPKEQRTEPVKPTYAEVKKDTITKAKKLQDFKNQSFQDRLRVGGSFGLSFGTFTNINLSPMAGYEVTEKLIAGVGVTGMYFKSKLYGINSFYYGGKGFLMYSIFPMVNLVGELEFMNVEIDTYQKYDARKWITSPMFGASYTQKIGDRYIKQVHFTALYNVNYYNQLDDYGNNISPYGTPFVFRVTFL